MARALILALALLAAVASSVVADDVYQPAAVDETFARLALPGKPAAAPNAAVQVHSVVQPGSQTYEWNLWAYLENFASAGQNVAVVAQADKNGDGSTWALNGEMRCYNPHGGCYAGELDIALYGNQPADGHNVGLMVLAANKVAPAPASLEHMILVSELPYRADKVRVARGVAIEMLCTQACLTVREGQRIGLSSDGSVAFRFDQATRAVQIMDGDRVAYTFPLAKP